MGKFVLAQNMSQCTYRCVVLPDMGIVEEQEATASQCTYRCVVLPDHIIRVVRPHLKWSQCTYRCVVLPDKNSLSSRFSSLTCLNAPTGAWCSLTQPGGQ